MLELHWVGPRTMRTRITRWSKRSAVRRIVVPTVPARPATARVALGASLKASEAGAVNKPLAKSKNEKASGELVVPMTKDAFDACSKSGDFLDVLLTQTVHSSIIHLVPDDQRDKHTAAAAAALVGIQPKGELEGMLAAQLIACHNAAMECYRRAMSSQLQARDCHLNQANKLSRTYTMLLEALNRHRGKGQQKVTVEHVHVHQGGQAIVGHVQQSRGGVNKETEDQPHAKATSDAGELALRRQDPEGHTLPISGDAER